MKTFRALLLRPFGQRTEAGMSLIEIIIVLGLVGGLMAMVVAGVTSGGRTARIHETELSFGQLRSSMQMFRMHNTRYPTSEQGLKSLVENPGVNTWRGPYCEPELLKDAWGGEIQYEGDGRKMKFTSAGEDEQFGTEDDIMWPTESVTTANAKG